MARDRLELGREDETLRGLRVVERLDTQPVAAEEQRLPLPIPDGEGEHATKSFDASLAVLLVQVHDDLGVRGRREPMPLRMELDPELPVVVDAAVEDHG